MKKIYSLVAGLLLTASVWAQAPQKMSYQAVIRNSSNALVTSVPVGMQISILQGTPTGTVAYSETQTVSTNANGLVSLEIGNGTPVIGTFAAINWANGPYFIKTETDPTGGTNYTIVGTNELMSVPYALFSANGTPGATGAQGPIGLTGAQGIQGIVGNNGTDGTNGTNGTNGLSAYDVWIGLGNVGTQTDFINSLTGPQGTIGLPGTNGAVGATGSAGPAGVDGAAGAQGNQGLPGTNGAVGATGAQGPIGNNGATGAQGLAGADGQGGVTTAGSGINVTGAGTAASPYVVSATSPCGLAIGQTYQGGIIFYLDPSGCHGLIAASSNQSTSATWWNGSYLDTRAYGSGLFEGKYNTLIINDTQGGASSAAAICGNLTLGVYSDWYLPSIEELNKMYQNIGQGNALGLGNVGGFASDYYWSSTASSNDFAAWGQFFTNGNHIDFGRNNAFYVRAIRAF